MAKTVEFKVGDMVLSLLVVGKVVKCGKCGREILVERVVDYTDHTVSLNINCWGCLDEKTKKKAREMYQLDEGVGE